MTLSREDVAAFADGELEGARHEEVSAAIAADPKLADQVRTHQAMRAQLSAHFAPIMEAPVPERLSRLLDRRETTVVDLGDARRERADRRSPVFPRWGWVAGPALAASLALALFVPGQNQGDRVEGQLAIALDQQLVAAQTAHAPHRMLLTFRNTAGEYCRVFTSLDQSGIACREPGGWRLEHQGTAAGRDKSEYRMAGNPAAKLLERAQAMADGRALDAAQERAARDRGWR